MLFPINQSLFDSVAVVSLRDPAALANQPRLRVPAFATVLLTPAVSSRETENGHAQRSRIIFDGAQSQKPSRNGRRHQFLQSSRHTPPLRVTPQAGDTSPARSCGFGPIRSAFTCAHNATHSSQIKTQLCGAPPRSREQPPSTRLRTFDLPQNEQDNCSDAAVRDIWQVPSGIADCKALSKSFERAR
jgi:hypothetical protein